MIPIYRSGWQLFKVRAVCAFSLILLPVAVYFGIWEIRTFWLIDFREVAMGVGVILLGIAFAVGMWLYGRQYAARIEFDPDKQQLHVYTIRFFWDEHHVIDAADVRGSRYNTDIQGIPSPEVYAPWWSIQIKNWRWPLIIDQQGKMLNPELMESLMRVFDLDALRKASGKSTPPARRRRGRRRSRK